jgi:hypothetical protein
LGTQFAAVSADIHSWVVVLPAVAVAAAVVVAVASLVNAVIVRFPTFDGEAQGVPSCLHPHHPSYPSLPHYYRDSSCQNPSSPYSCSCSSTCHPFRPCHPLFSSHHDKEIQEFGAVEILGGDENLAAAEKRFVVDWYLTLGSRSLVVVVVAAVAAENIRSDLEADQPG